MSEPNSVDLPHDEVPGLREPETGPASQPWQSRVRDEDRKTRKPMGLGARLWLPVTALVGMVVVFWAELVQNPIMTPEDAFRITVNSGTGRFLYLTFLVSVLLQVHYLICEKSAGYYAAWQKIFAANDRVWSKVAPWTKVWIGRVAKIILLLILVSLVLAAVFKVSPWVSLFYAPMAIAKVAPMAAQLAFAFFFVIFQFVGMFWFLSRGGVETYMPDDIKTRFTDVWGQDQVLERIKENILFLENPQAIESKGGYVPGGILLWGPPGTGKTLMAEAVAGETGKPYVFVDPGAFTQMFMGIGILKVKSLFRKLRKLALKYDGVIVFFDEADTLGSRGGSVANARKAGEPSRVAAALGGDLGGAVDVHGCNGRGFVSSPARRYLAEQDLAQAQRQFVMGGMGGGGAGMDGTLQALLTELSGLKKPRGFYNRVVRKALGMRPKPPPRYRMLVMMATNMPDSLDPALLRPGRIDRIYRVGYPSKQGRVDTFANYLNKISHNLTDEQIDKLATISPYATGATIKDTVNEALVQAIRDGRETVNFADVIRAKSLKQHGLPDGSNYVDRERHSVALHEACHAVVMYRLQRTSIIDTATIERRGDVGGFVSPIPVEERFVEWRSEVEVDVMTFLASLAGERLFYNGDHTQGVGGDMSAATAIVTRSFLSHAMGPTLRAYSSNMLGQAGLHGPTGQALIDAVPFEGETGRAIEAKLQDLYDKTVTLLAENRREVLAVTHALETHLTLTGDDVVAVIEGHEGPLLDGSMYVDPAFVAKLEAYHERAVEVHLASHDVPPPLPELPRALADARTSSQ